MPAPVGRTDLGERTLPGVARVCAWVVLGVAVLVLVGWALGLDGLTQVAPGLVSMKFNTAAALLLLSVSLLVSRPAVAVGAPALVAVVALVTLGEYLLSTTFGIDELFVTDAEPADSRPGRMAAATAAALLLLAAARLLLHLRRYRWVQPLALVALILAFLAATGYLFGVEALYRITTYSAMAVHTSLGVGLLSVAAAALVPGGLLVWTVQGRDAGAVLLRRMSLVVVAVIPFLGYLQLRGQDAGLYDERFGLAVTVLSACLVVAVAMVLSARTLQRLDASRLAAVDQLRDLNADLEDRVRDRSEALERERTRVAVYEDRDRIAGELHDRVIQRIFAAGMQLQGTLDRVPDDVAAQRLFEVIGELDETIAELRGAIFGLSLPSRAGDITAALEETAARARRVLGFMPRVIVSGDTTVLPADLRDAMLAVEQEALSNVARHAGASEVEVSLVLDGDPADDERAGAEAGPTIGRGASAGGPAAPPQRATLVISDDGKGMPDSPPHTSGIANIRQRAVRMGGSAGWEPVSPHGTRLVWQVPLGRPTPTSPSETTI